MEYYFNSAIQNLLTNQSKGKLTSLARCDAPGLVMSAIPLHNTAVSSTKAHSGRLSSGGSSITSSPISRNKLEKEKIQFIIIHNNNNNNT